MIPFNPGIYMQDSSGAWTPESADTETAADREVDYETRIERRLRESEIARQARTAATSPDGSISQTELGITGWLFSQKKGPTFNAARDEIIIRSGVNIARFGQDSLENMLRDYRQWDVQKRLQAQQLLALSGYLDLDTSWDGLTQPDSSDVKAWALAVRDAALAGEGVYDFLQERIQAQGGIDAILAKHGGGGGSGGGGAARPIQLISDQDARALAENHARNRWGRKPTDEEVDLITGVLHEMQRREQSAYNAGGSTVTSPTDLNVATDDAVEELRPIETRAHDAALQFQTFAQLLQGGM